MKLVIDIPDDDYKFIKDLQSLIIGGRGSCKTIQKNVINAIRNGTPYEERPKGKWVLVRWMQYNCSECGYYYIGTATNYCPNCGARMESGV